MHFATHKTLSWLLMLALVIGPMQSAQAMDMSQPAVAAACLQMMGGDAGNGSGQPGMDQPACAQQPSSPDPCPEMDGCTGFSSLNIATLEPGPLTTHALLLRLRLFGADARLRTRYPDLLQRPPQI
jgi:hypothetical protein